MKNKKIKEKIKDFFYDHLDYIMIASVLLVTILVINWKMGCLFDARNILSSEKVISSSNENPLSENKVDDKSDDNKKVDDKEEEKVKEIDITIPKGAVSDDVAEILEEEGLIEDKADFHNYVKEKNMETKLKYGEYKISSDASFDEIIEILSK